MSGHTKGPWRIVLEDGHWIVRGANYDAVCRLYAGGNGDLIAAAPDLLEACKALQMEAAARHCGLRIADEAIAKAEGR
jgi:hypothetical protein